MGCCRRVSAEGEDGGGLKTGETWCGGGISILLDGLLPPLPPPSSLAARLLTLPELAVSTPPFGSASTPPPFPGCRTGLLLTELILLGGAGGGPLRRDLTAKEWLRLRLRSPALEDATWWPRPGLRDKVA